MFTNERMLDAFIIFFFISFQVYEVVTVDLERTEHGYGLFYRYDGTSAFKIGTIFHNFWHDLPFRFTFYSAQALDERTKHCLGRHKFPFSSLSLSPSLVNLTSSDMLENHNRLQILNYKLQSMWLSSMENTDRQNVQYNYSTFMCY